MNPLISGISSTSAALDAGRIRMELIYQNIANANTTRGLDGKPYQRQQVVFESALSQAGAKSGLGADLDGPKISRVSTDGRPGRSVHLPGHPHADGNGMVILPNVSVPEEMADLVSASRAYEANLAVFKNARQMALQTLSIGKR
ncbi:MAG: flagellar basal body rod protein FlgC [Limisphaerales bacterium]